jgi:hypothetical protein
MAARRLLAMGVAALALGALSCDLRSVFAWEDALPVQCGGNPWESGPGSAPRGSEAEIQAVRDTLASQGIRVQELGFIDLHEVVCAACTCPRGDLLVIRADPREAWKLVAEHGFAYLFARRGQRWLTKPLLQCGDVWQRPGQPHEEEDAFRQWAADQGIAVSLFGLVEPAYPPPVCFGCGCARGDRVLVSVHDPKSERLLRDAGFTSPFE